MLMNEDLIASAPVKKNRFTFFVKKLKMQKSIVFVRTSNNTAVSSTVTGQSVASSGSDEPSRVPVV